MKCEEFGAIMEGMTQAVGYSAGGAREGFVTHVLETVETQGGAMSDATDKERSDEPVIRLEVFEDCAVLWTRGGISIDTFCALGDLAGVLGFDGITGKGKPQGAHSMFVRMGKPRGER